MVKIRFYISIKKEQTFLNMQNTLLKKKIGLFYYFENNKEQRANYLIDFYERQRDGLYEDYIAMFTNNSSTAVLERKHSSRQYILSRDEEVILKISERNKEYLKEDMESSKKNIYSLSLFAFLYIIGIWKNPLQILYDYRSFYGYPVTFENLGMFLGSVLMFLVYFFPWFLFLYYLFRMINRQRNIFD